MAPARALRPALGVGVVVVARSTPRRSAGVWPRRNPARRTGVPARAPEDGGAWRLAAVAAERRTARRAHVPLELGNVARVEELCADPRVLVLRDFVPRAVCEAIAKEAEGAGYGQSPVAYAGWSLEFANDVKVFARGPALWASLVAVLVANNAVPSMAGDRVALAGVAAAAYVAGAALGAALAYASVSAKRAALASSRTSQSVALDPGRHVGAEWYVAAAERLFGCSREFFERPTAIKYGIGDRLAPHFDANVAASDEDADRGGQTVATLLLYLTDPAEGETGGQTRFGRLGIDVSPSAGDALLFFPADADGHFDDRVEHEGVAPVAGAKAVCRIWRHLHFVPAPVGLGPPAL